MTDVPQLAEAFAKEVAKQLPVKEALTPAVAPTGQLMADLVKTIQLALAPLQFAAAYQDRLRNFIDASVRRVSPANRVSPAPQILGPIIEGIRYEPEGTPIDQMFSELLSRSMDAEHLNEAHPAYPFLIKQLSADEARILRSLRGASFPFVYTVDFDSKTKLFGHRKIEIDELPRNDLAFPIKWRSISNTSTIWAWRAFSSLEIRSRFMTAKRESKQAHGRGANIA